MVSRKEKAEYLAALRLKAKGWKSVHEIQMEYARSTLSEFDGNKTHAAYALGISITTMRDWISRFPAEDNKEIECHSSKS